MKKSEPTLVPEWLKNAGGSTGGSSIPQSDDRATSRITRNKSIVNSNDHDFGRSGSDMTTSSYLRRSSSSNGSGHLRPYSSFGRNQCGKEWEKDTYDSREKGKVVLGNRTHRDYSDPLGSKFTFERDGLRRSQSMINDKHADTWQKKAATELSSYNSNGLHIRSNPVHEVKRNTFERDFPSLGADEKAVVSEVGRIPSPGLSSAIQSLPIGTSVALGGEKWTSALAEVPLLVGSNGTSFSSVQLAAPSSSTSAVSDTTTSLNMAKTIAQGHSRVQTTPQMAVGTQRLEELAMKQSRQLIPVTPALPKTLVVNTSDKQKTKQGQHHPPVSSSLPVTHSPHCGLVNGDVSKTLNAGKLHVLKPVREKNGVTSVLKDTSSPTNGCKVSSTVTAAGLVSGSALTRGPPNKPAERKPVVTAPEKRPTSQARSRNDFFNQVRKKSMTNSSVSDSVTANTSCVTNKLTETEAVLAPNTQAGETPLSESLNGNLLSEGSDDMTCNGDDSHAQDNIQTDAINGKFSEEEEAAFLRSMGWKENADEDGLTEEEINEFYQDATKYIKVLEGASSKWLSH